MFLEPRTDEIILLEVEIKAHPAELSSTSEEPLSLKRVTVSGFQDFLGSPSDVAVKKTLENTTRLYKKGDRVSGVLHPRGHVKMRLPRLSAIRIRRNMRTDAVLSSSVASVRGHNCFQLFW